MELTINKTSFELGLKYGFSLGVVYIVFEIIRALTNTHYRTTNVHVVFRILIFIITVFSAIFQFNKKKVEKLKIKNALIIGVSISLIVSLMLIAYYSIYTTIIEPDYTETYAEIFRPDHLRNYPNLTSEQIDADSKEGLVSVWQNDIIFMLINLGGLSIASISGLIMRTKIVNQKS